jgi:archaellum biogenesis ATPase FlaH
MDNEIIKTGILHPEIIPDIFESGILENKNEKKLKSIYSIYLKQKAMPSFAILEKVFKFSFDEENKADTAVVYQHLSEFNANRFSEALQKRAWSEQDLSPSVINALQKEYIKDYTQKEESRFCLSSKKDLLKLKSLMNAKEESFIKTGFSSINDLTKGKDKKLPGGWRPSSLYTIMGLSGFGKSIFLSNFARDSWALGNNVLYISTEMGHLETYDRILKSYYEVDGFNEIILVEGKKPFPSGEIEVIKVHPNDTTYLDIQNMIDQLNWVPDLLFIDYADELKSHERSSNDYEGQGIIYAGLKKLAEENNIPIITATQTNRTAENSKKGGTKGWVGMGAIADSTKKIRLVDMLLSITQSPKEKKENILNLLVLKNRFGKSQIKISFKIDYEKMLLTEMDSIDVFLAETKLQCQSVENEKPLPVAPPQPISIELNRRGKI